MLSLLAAALAMAVRDALATFLVVAENRGKAWLAGGLDALGDLASIAVTVVGAGEVILHGFTGHTIAVLAVLLGTSFFGTALWTRLAQRIAATPERTSHEPALRSADARRRVRVAERPKETQPKGPTEDEATQGVRPAV